VLDVGSKIMNNPTLYIFSGLPASGKTTLARLLSQQIKAFYIRIDTVEQGLRDLCNYKVEGEGYRLSYRLARDNLVIGHSVIADSCNPIALTRAEWQAVATATNANYVNIEVYCSDKNEHKYRVDSRECTTENMQLPTWHQVQNREYDKWDETVIRIDTFNKKSLESLKELVEKLAKNYAYSQ